MTKESTEEFNKRNVMMLKEARLRTLKAYEEKYKIEVEILEGGALPFKKNKTDAGFDLIATEDIELRPGDVIRHPLNIRFKLPKGSWARIETKSGLGSRGMLVFAGVIDEGYRGVPHVIMTNVNQNIPGQLRPYNTLNIKKGEKIAQMTMNPHSTEFYIEEVEAVDIDTDRGEDGFGSTGL